MPVHFYRKFKRGVPDIFRTGITPRAQTTLNALAQKISFYNSRHHRWQNRTGALQDSIGWMPTTRYAAGWRTVIFAGGWAHVRYAFDYGRRVATNQKRRNVRYQRGQRFHPAIGTGLWVNYAAFVEAKGFPVLTQGIDRYRPLIKHVLRQGLKVGRLYD